MSSTSEVLPGFWRHECPLSSTGSIDLPQNSGPCWCGKSFSPPDSPNRPQPAPRRGFAPCTWDLVITDMKDRDVGGERKYGLRHQWDNGRDHLVDAYQENLDQSLYLRAEIQKRRRMQELARGLVGPENSAPLAELLELVLAGAP